MTETLYTISGADLAGLLPELILSGAGVLVLLLEAFFPGTRRLMMPLSLAGVLAAAHFAFWESAPGLSFSGLLESSALTVCASLIVLVATSLATLSSDGYLGRERLRKAEYYALLLWCAAGLLLMIRGNELVTIFVALELFSVCLYVLAAYHRRLAFSTEAGLKYFLMGAFVSAFVLLGIALLYGEVGSTRLVDIAGNLDPASPLAVLGLLLLVAGFGFKMSLAPFHAWAPDTYQGAPSPFVGFLSVAPKVAAAVVMIRILAIALETNFERWNGLVAILAVLSMLVGNLLALVQRDIKRMLAYSGVAHMGYLMVPLAGLGGAEAEGAREAVLLYLLAYALMNAGAFAVVGMLYSEAGEQHLISDLGGRGYRFPVLGLSLTVCMLSLGGIPPTLGFIGKYLIFVEALEGGRLWLALAIVVTSLIGVFYYLRVVYTLYMRPEVRSADDLSPDFSGRLAAGIAAAATLVLGVWPPRLLGWIYDLAQRSP